MGELLEIKTFKQPNEGVREGAIVSLRRGEREVCRFVNGRAIEWYSDSSYLSRIFHDWIKFEQKIGSKEL